jgi:amidase
MAVQGPIARSVADLELGFEVMAQPHVRDPYCFAPAAFPATGQPRRVALVAGGHGVHPAVAESVRAAGRLLEAAGYDVEEVEPPELEATTQLWPCLAMGDVVAQLAPVIDSTGDASSRRAMALWKTAWPFGSADMTLAALVERDRLLRKWQRFLADYPLVLMPVSNAPPFPAGADLIDEATTARINAAQGPLMAVSVLGLPAVSVPLGRHQGAPLGVQLVAGLWREDICFAAARAIEQRIPAISAIDPFMTTQETCELP